MAFFVRTKTNRLKMPPHLKDVDLDMGRGVSGTNWCGQVPAKVGDFIVRTGHGVSAGTVGKIIRLDNSWVKPENPHILDVSADLELLDGKIDTTWLWYLTVIDEAALQEVKDFYIQDGRPERIKVTW